MSKSYSQIQAQIQKLQREAEAIRLKEVSAVVTKIRSAIEHYGLTAEDLGLRGRTPKVAKSANGASVSVIKKSRRKASVNKAAGVIKYRDDAGDSWTGHGKRPNWFLDALAGGKSAEDMRI